MGTLSESIGTSFEIVPIFKYSVQNGLAAIVDRTQDLSGTWSSQEQLVTFPVKFVADLQNLRVGWLGFVLNRPDFHTVPLADLASGKVSKPPRPSIEHKNGFMLRIYNKAMGMREWRAQQKCVLAVMDKLYDQYLAAPESIQGMLPVLEISGVKPLKQDGMYPRTDMQPVVAITSWVPRPAALPMPEEEPESGEETPVAAITGNGAQPPRPYAAIQQPRPALHVPPPPRITPAAPPVDADEPEFP
jgi:hypothetical protein